MKRLRTATRDTKYFRSLINLVHLLLDHKCRRFLAKRFHDNYGLLVVLIRNFTWLKQHGCCVGWNALALQWPLMIIFCGNSQDFSGEGSVRCTLGCPKVGHRSVQWKHSNPAYKCYPNVLLSYPTWEVTFFYVDNLWTTKARFPRIKPLWCFLWDEWLTSKGRNDVRRA